MHKNYYIQLLEERRDIKSKMEQAHLDKKLREVEYLRNKFIEISSKIREVNISKDETPTKCLDCLEPEVMSFEDYHKIHGSKEIKNIIHAINEINLPLGVYALMYKAVRESENYILKHLYASRQL